jgi:hypothetical protein
MICPCECPSHADPPGGRAVLPDLTWATLAWTHRSRGDFIVQSCLPTRVGLGGVGCSSWRLTLAPRTQNLTRFEVSISQRPLLSLHQQGYTLSKAVRDRLRLCECLLARSGSQYEFTNSESSGLYIGPTWAFLPGSMSL